MAQQKFLDQFEARWRGTIGDQICRIIRSGVTNADDVLNQMRKRCRENIESQYEPEFYGHLWEQLGTFDARAMVVFYLWRESLPYEQKAELKNQWKENQQNQRQQAIPPTAKQMEYLAKLGVEQVPANMHEASQLISKAIRR